MTRLVSRKTLGIWRVEGLEVWTRDPKPKDLFIDLTQFGRSWRQELLESQLRQQAHQLFPESSRNPGAA